MSILDDIVQRKRQELAARQATTPVAELTARVKDAPAVRDFLAALRDPPGVQVIAEIKRASPAAGQLRVHPDILAIAQVYEAHGAACISVLTDEHFFQGSLDDLRAVRSAVSLPVLRKDFVLDRYQLLEAREAGADAFLLIAEILDDSQLRALREEGAALGMAALVECYSERNLDRVIASGAALIGINNRDLATFRTSVEHTLALAPRVPGDRLLVSESGIRLRSDVDRLAGAGVKAVLVGETLMRSPDPGQTLRQLRGLP
jgi:indole-3-glycerol phosphate synthase